MTTGVFLRSCVEAAGGAGCGAGRPVPNILRDYKVCLVGRDVVEALREPPPLASTSIILYKQYSLASSSSVFQQHFQQHPTEGRDRRRKRRREKRGKGRKGGGPDGVRDEGAAGGTAGSREEGEDGGMEGEKWRKQGVSC